MKKNSLKVLTAALILSTATFAVQSCSNDDDPIITTPAGSFEPGNFKGEITSGTTITLDPSKVYKLTGSSLPEPELKLQEVLQPTSLLNRAGRSLPTVLRLHLLFSQLPMRHPVPGADS